MSLCSKNLIGKKEGDHIKEKKNNTLRRDMKYLIIDVINMVFEVMTDQIYE